MTATNKQNVTINTEGQLALERALYGRSFYDFVLRAWREVDPSELIPNWHIEAICAHLQAVAEGRIKRLLINIPPGTAKSMIVAVLFPVWMWTHRPDWRAISTSHSLDRAIQDTRKSRDLIRSEWYQERWPIEFKEDQDRKSSYENQYRGFREAKPFTSLTGSRGNCVIIDDPHSVDGAKSEAERTSAVETFLEAVPNRLNDLKRDTIIVIMQRLHEEDVAGCILERPELGYEHLCIPMEYEGDKQKTSIGWKDPRKRDGQLLFSERFPKNEIARIKASMGPTVYAGQYQQRPSPREAGELDVRWFNRFKQGEHPTGCNYYMTSDHAPGAHGDYNVFRMWGLDAKRNLWLVDSFRKRCKMDEALGIKRDEQGNLKLMGTGALPMIRRWKPRAFFPERDHTWLAVEDVFRSALRETSTHVRIASQATTGMGDKVAKVQSYVALASMGQVYLPLGPVGDDALLEYGKFPTGKHDDQVDADGMIGRVFDQLHPGRVITEEELFSRNRDYGPSRSQSGSDSDAHWI